MVLDGYRVLKVAQNSDKLFVNRKSLLSF